MPKKLESRLRLAKRSIASYSNRLRRRRKNSRKATSSVHSASDSNLLLLQSALAKQGLEEADSQNSTESGSVSKDFLFDSAAIIDSEVRTMLRAKLENLSLCNELIEKHSELLMKSISRESSALCRSTLDSLLIFKMTSEAMLRASTDLTQFLTNECRKLGILLRKDRETRIALEKENVELKLELMKIKNELSLKCLKLADKEDVVDSDLEDMFFDAASVIDFTPRRFDSCRISRRIRRSTGASIRSVRDSLSERPSSATGASSEPDYTSTSVNHSTTINIMQRRRSRVSERPSVSLNYLSLMKNCIGKDLSRITMPISFNEPLSILQRLTADLEYSSLLDEASEISDPLRQLAFVAVFALSGYSTTGLRTTKPFNPLLGETYECDRSADLGWKSVAEQVSHHPPVSAMHAEGKGWTLAQSYTMTSKIRGKTLSVTPVGSTRISFSKTGTIYTYSKATTATTITNLMTGRIVTDNVGEVVVTNAEKANRCVLRFQEAGYFVRDASRKVSGEVVDCEGTVLYRIEAVGDKEARMTHESSTTEEVLWKCHSLPESSRKMHCFTKFEIELNEPEEGVAPTDSRLRPDQRQMEDGDWETAAHTKQELEDLQRKRRTGGGRDDAEYEPLWFRKAVAAEGSQNEYEFTGEYWDSKAQGTWDKCVVDIFGTAENR
ncbi:hypothetical protein QR680_005467 [Steinernema hermaphroditum]|uniref:Oxysterol-binding protein n=1 Tax=Steinernema hermaphroditum TaxID=289476 RepID=A0AA39LVQ1_9BILA|nr:hypothetical protein QR680_005467 [Steinernema hermaphroditum]